MVPTYDEFCSGTQLGPIFEQNVRLFLNRELKRKACDLSSISAPKVRSCWYAFLEFYDDYKMYKVPIYIYEEDHMNDDDDVIILPTCDHCRGAGWGRHFIPRLNYHIMIPKNGVFAQPDDEEQNFESALKKGVLMDISTCSLYGLIHGHGFGHLVSVQRSNNCEFLSGIKIMQLWDRICTYLGTRKISLRDDAKMGPMDLRVLYAVALEHTWFGEWDYCFSRGSFGVTEARYKEALVSLKALTLEEITECGIDNEQRKRVQKLIKFYRGRCTLKGKLHTIEDLFHRMLQGIRFFKSTKEKRELAALAYSLYDGSMEIDLQEDEASLAERIVDSLKRKRQISVWTKRTDLLDEYRDNKKQADKVLKRLDGKRVGDHFIDKRTSSSVEYRISDVGVPGSNMYSDMIYLYQHIFTKISGPQSIKADTQVLLDTVQFKKEFPRPTQEQRILVCSILNRRFGRSEHGDILVRVPPGSTFGDLKKEACRAIKETYCVCGAASHFVVEAIEGDGGLGDTAVVPEQLIGSELNIGLVLNVQPSRMCLMRYQGGPNALTRVDCIQCGAKDDDGEEMVFCENCWVLQHRRCHQLHVETVGTCSHCEPDSEPE